MELKVSEQDLQELIIQYLDKMGIKHQGLQVSMRFIGGRRKGGKPRNPSHAVIRIGSESDVNLGKETVEETIEEIVEEDLPIAPDLQKEQSTQNIFTQTPSESKSLFGKATNEIVNV